MSLLNVVYCSVAITDRIFRRFENQSINIQTKLETVPLHNISIDVFLNLSVGKLTVIGYSLCAITGLLGIQWLL